MTIRDKLRMEHPECNANTIHETAKCPAHYGYPNTYDCIGITCKECWDREIPGTEKIEEPKKCIGLSYEEKQKLLRFVLELSDEERDHLLDYINALDELAHKQEMADNICERFLNCERKDV